MSVVDVDAESDAMESPEACGVAPTRASLLPSPLGSVRCDLCGWRGTQKDAMEHATGPVECFHAAMAQRVRLQKELVNLRDPLTEGLGACGQYIVVCEQKRDKKRRVTPDERRVQEKEAQNAEETLVAFHRRHPEAVSPPLRGPHDDDDPDRLPASIVSDDCVTDSGERPESHSPTL